MKYKTILITGINGVIGTTIQPLFNEGWRLYGLDSKPPFSDSTFKADIAHYDDVERVFKQIKPHVVIHLAASSWPKAHWDYILAGNIKGTHNIYECARKYGVQRIVFASTNHVVGREHDRWLIGKRTHSISLNDGYAPDGDYAISKIFGEELARWYFYTYNVETICLRIGSVIKDNIPRTKREQSQWLSQRDLRQAILRAIVTHTRYGVYFIASNNQTGAFDIAPARKDLNFTPQDSV